MTNKETLKKLQTEAERRWAEVKEARRKAAEADQKYKDALYEWYEQGGINADQTPNDPSR